MTKPIDLRLVAGLVLLTLGGCSDQTAYTVCESTYALCTTALCQPIAGKDDTVACACDVETGYSLGTEPCHSETETSETKQISSRYYPIKSYASCDNDRPWANCLDSPCTIDSDDPGKATCACTVVKDKGPYVVVTDTYTDSTCTTDLWSSATVKDANAVTDFLKTNEDLRPFEVKVLNSPN